MHIRVAPPVDKPAPSKAVRGASSPSAAVMCRSPVDPSTPTFDPARTKLLKVVPSHVLLKPIDALLAPAPSASGRSCASHVAGVRKLLPLKLDMCIVRRRLARRGEARRATGGVAAASLAGLCKREEEAARHFVA